MIPSLAPILTGDLEHYAGTLALADDPRPAIPGPDLLKPAVLDDLLGKAAAHIGEGDRRAQISLWHIDYVHYLMPVPMVASLLLGRMLPLRLEDIAVILDDEFMPAAIRLRDDGHLAQPACPFERFDAMIRGNLQPMIEAWADYSGIAPRVLWTNAANLYEAILRAMEQREGMPPELIAMAERVIAEPQRPDGAPNPFHRPVIYRPEHPKNQRWRRICCVRYLIPRYKYCSNCPHLLSAEGRAPAQGSSAA